MLSEHATAPESTLHPAPSAPELKSGACYLYAIVGSNDPMPMTPVGVGGGAVGFIRVGELIAVASTIRSRRIRPRRRELKAHQQVLNELFASSTGGCLPFSFGTIVPDVEDLRNVLQDKHDSIVKQLRQVAGCVEVGFSLAWDVPDVPAWFVSQYPELAAQRDAAFRHGTPGQETLLALGQRFDQIRTSARDAAHKTVMSHLAGRVRDVRRNPERQESAVVDLSVLLNRDELPMWDKLVQDIAAAFDDNYLVSMVGPFPPFSFVDLQLD